jgi:hypothetical protein
MYRFLVVLALFITGCASTTPLGRFGTAVDTTLHKQFSVFKVTPGIIFTVSSVTLQVPIELDMRQYHSDDKVIKLDTINTTIK